MLRALIFALIGAVVVVPSPANAEQYAAGQQVVHTRLAPVIVHRVFPPYRGVHVYQPRAARR